MDYANVDNAADEEFFWALHDHTDRICDSARNDRLLTGGVCEDQERWYEGRRALRLQREAETRAQSHGL